MKRSSQKGSRSFAASWLRGKQAGLIGAVVVMFLLAGCGRFLSEKATEIEAERTLQGLSRIQDIQDPNISVPEAYKSPPRIMEQIVGGTSEWKLFYFCKYHTSDYLQEIIHKQFATSLFDKKGKETKIVDYTVSSNPATNQLVVRCPAQEDAEAVLEVLKHADIQPIQVKIDCLISEVYADMTMDRETTILIQNLFGEAISLGGKYADGTLLPAFPGAALRDAARSRFGLLAGYLRNDEVRYLMDILESRGYLKILMNPTLEVVNGQTAKIRAMENVPLQQVYLRDMRSEFYETRIEYHEVIDSLEITPHVFADGYIGLETDVLIGAKSTPEGVKQVPVVTERQVTNKENRIRHGESLVIGGIRKTERRAVIRGVPILKDIPVIGFLFSSKDFEERAKETIFIITPTISTGGIPNEEMMEKVRKSHESFSTEDTFDPNSKTSSNTPNPILDR
ncbi:MAG: type II secretion system protein GspD [Planctomycetota bacterium]